MSSTSPTDAGAPQTGGFFDYLKQHPKGFWFFFWGEFAERCSYYGMRAILSLYMAKQLGLDQADAATYMSFFIAACYFLPLLGGFIADNYLGKYWTIVGFSVPYVVGQLIVGIENKYCLAGALVLLAMGSGVIKPNISTLMGLTYDQQRPGQDKLRTDAFSIFYFSINLGAALSQFAMPWLRDQYGYQVAFMFPAALMAIALTIFALGKPYYAKEVIARQTKTPEEKAQQWRVLGRIAGLFILVMFFWAIFDQAASTWIFFADTYMDTTIFGYEVSADAIQGFNPVFIILFLPLVMLFWKYLDRRGIKVRATDKMIVGFLLTALTMAIMSTAGYLAGPTQPDERPVLDKQTGEPIVKDGKPVTEKYVAPENKVTVWWQVLAYLILTIAEILISVTGLELAFVAAPASMKSFVTACWLLTVALANLFINAPITRLYPTMAPGDYFAMLAGIMIVVTVAFVFMAGRFNRSQEGAAPEAAAQGAADPV